MQFDGLVYRVSRGTAIFILATESVKTCSLYRCQEYLPEVLRWSELEAYIPLRPPSKEQITNAHNFTSSFLYGLQRNIWARGSAVTRCGVSDFFSVCRTELLGLRKWRIKVDLLHCQSTSRGHKCGQRSYFVVLTTLVYLSHEELWWISMEHGWNGV